MVRLLAQISPVRGTKQRKLPVDGYRSDSWGGSAGCPGVPPSPSQEWGMASVERLLADVCAVPVPKTQTQVTCMQKFRCWLHFNGMFVLFLYYKYSQKCRTPDFQEFTCFPDVFATKPGLLRFPAKPKEFSILTFHDGASSASV